MQIAAERLDVEVTGRSVGTGMAPLVIADTAVFIAELVDEILDCEMGRVEAVAEDKRRAFSRVFVIEFRSVGSGEHWHVVDLLSVHGMNQNNAAISASVFWVS